MADETVALLRSRLRRPESPDRGRIRLLIAQLNDAHFRVRDKAFAELRGLGPVTEPELQKALARDPSVETRRRLEALLRQIEQGESPDPESRREQRAVTVLGRVGTPEAVRYLREIAAWPAGTYPSRQAGLTLRQLGQR